MSTQPHAPPVEPSRGSESNQPSSTLPGAHWPFLLAMLVAFGVGLQVWSLYELLDAERKQISYQTRVETSKVLIEERAEQLDSLRTQDNKLRGSAETLQQHHDQLAKTVSSRETALETLKAREVQTQQAISVMQETSSALGNDVDLLKKELKALQADKDAMQSETQSLKTEFGLLEDSVATKKASLAIVEQQLTTDGTLLKEKQAELVKLQAERATEDTKLSAAIKSVTTIIAKKQQADATIAAAETLTGRLGELKLDIESQDEIFSSKEIELAAFTQKATDLEKSNKALDKIMASKQETLEDVTERWTSAELAHAKLLKETADLEQKQTDLKQGQAEFAKTTREADELLAGVDEAKREKKTLEQTQMNLTKEKMDLTAEIAALQESKTKLSTQQVSDQAKSNELEIDILQANASLKSLNAELAKFEIQRVNAAEMLAKVEADIATANTAKNEATKAKANEQKNLAGLESNLKIAQQELAKLRFSITEADAAVAKARSKQLAITKQSADAVKQLSDATSGVIDAMLSDLSKIKPPITNDNAGAIEKTNPEKTNPENGPEVEADESSTPEETEASGEADDATTEEVGQ